MRPSPVLTSVVLTLLLSAACSGPPPSGADASGAKDPGTEGGPCLAGSKCLSGLTCYSNLCVDAGGAADAAARPGPDAAASGVDASQGTSDAGNGPETDAGLQPDREWTRWPSEPDAPPAGNFQVSNGIVTDQVTGLEWQQSLTDSLYDWADAKTYCTGLSLGGAGWRLPTLVEARVHRGLQQDPPLHRAERLPQHSGGLFLDVVARRP
ncbi:MAG: DUF1566 domain-containing protein [Myxococcales bacterium]